MSGSAFELNSVTPSSAAISTSVVAGGFNFPVDGFFQQQTSKERQVQTVVWGAVAVAAIVGVLWLIRKGRG